MLNSNEADRLSGVKQLKAIAESMEGGLSPIILIRTRVVTGLPIEYISRNIAQYGYSAEDCMSGKYKLSDLIHPEDVVRNNADLVDKVKSGAAEFMHEYRIVTADGQERWIEDRIVIERDENGWATHLQGMMVDVTERKITEQKLAESLAKTELIAKRLTALNQLSNQLLAASNLDEIYQVLLDGIHHIVPSDRVDISLLHNGADTELQIVAFKGIEGYLTVDTRWHVEDWMVESTSKMDQHVNLEVDADLQMLGLRASMTALLCVGESLVGVLRVASVEKDFFDEDELTLLQQLSSILASLLSTQKLIEQSKLIHTAINHASAVLVQWDAEQGFPCRFISDNIRQFGYEAEQFMSGELDYLDIVHPDDVDNEDNRIEYWHNLDIRELIDIYRIVTPSGDIRWVEDRSILERDDNGVLMIIHGIVIDITERKETQEQLELTKYSIDSATDAVFWVNEDGHIVYANTAASDLLAYSKSELRTLHVCEINTSIREENWADYVRERRDNNYRLYEATYLTKSGKRILVEISSNYHEVEGRKYLFAFVRDISERKAAERQLAVAQYSLDAAADGVVLVHPDGSLAYVNQAGCQMVGYSPDEILQMNVSDFDQMASRERYPKHFARIRDRKGWDSYETIYKHQDGTLFPVEVTINYIELHGEEFVFAVSRDITLRKKNEAKLRVANSMIERSPLMLLRWNAADWSINFASENFSRLGYSVENLRANAAIFMTDIVHPEDVDYVRNIVAEMSESRADEYTMQYRIRTSDGDIRWVTDLSSIERDKDGKITYYQAMMFDVTERKLAEDSLRITQYSVDEATDAIFWLDDQDNIIYANKAASKTLGYTQQELLGMTGSEINEQLPIELNDQLADTVNLNSYHKRKDGTVFPVEVTRNVQVIGGKQYIFTFVRDITAYKKAQDALHRSKANTQALLDNQPIAIAYTRHNGEFVYINQEFLRMFGRTEDELMQLNAGSFHTNPQSRIEMVAELQREGRVWQKEVSFTHPNKTQFDVSVSMYPIEFEDEPALITSVFDITELKAVQNKLRRSQVNLETILEAQPISICMTRYDGEFLYVNKEYRKLFGGHNQTSVTSSNASNTYRNPDDRVKIIEQLREDGYIWQLETECIRADGNPFWASMSMQTIEYEGEPAIVTSMFDLSERKEFESVLEIARDSAETANNAKSEFLSSMSHELRTPLNGILGYTQIMKRDSSVAPHHRQAIDVIHNSGEHLLTLINDVLDIAKIEARKLDLHDTPFHLASFIEEVGDIVLMRASGKGVHFVNEWSAALPSGVVADHTRLRQVLLNLLGNAIKFTNEGTVTLRVFELANTPVSSTLRFEVVDTGIGMNPADLKNIFNTFEQVGDRATRGDGTGLGLAISQQLIMKMGSEIYVESKLGHGSRFWFDVTFTTTTISGSSASDTAEYRVGYEGDPLSVLIVDDNATNRLVLNQLLAGMGFIIEEAEHGKEALDILVEFKADIIISDLVMPMMDGYEMIKRLRHSPNFAHTPVLAVSASTEERSGNSALNAGYDAFFPKPLNISQLLDSIGYHLELSWVYENDTTAALQVDLDALVWPDAAAIDILYDLVEIGDLNGAAEYVAKLAADDTNLVPFAEYVGQLARNFEDEELLQMLKPDDIH